MSRLEGSSKGWRRTKHVVNGLSSGPLVFLGESMLPLLLSGRFIPATCRDGTIISGDSLGMVKFWDSRTCTQIHSFQGHKADVLCLSVGPVCICVHIPNSWMTDVRQPFQDGSAVYTSGVDQKISQFSLVKTTG